MPPRPLPGPSAYALSFIGLIPTVLGLAIGLLALPMRFGLLGSDPALLWGLLVVGAGGCGAGLAVLGWRALQARRELAAGYTTLDGHPEVPRLDPRTGAVLRWPGEPEPARETIIERRVAKRRRMK